MISPSQKVFFVEINLYKKKWLINRPYNPHKNDLRKHFDTISKSLDTYSTKYKNILILGDFKINYFTINKETFEKREKGIFCKNK